MFDARGEDQHRVPIARVLDDLAAGRLDQLVLVHHLFEFVRHELAGADVQLRRVGLFAAGLGHQGAEVAVADQLEGLRPHFL